jgi:hypothetical protein
MMNRPDLWQSNEYHIFEQMQLGAKKIANLRAPGTSKVPSTSQSLCLLTFLCSGATEMTPTKHSHCHL